MKLGNGNAVKINVAAIVAAACTAATTVRCFLLLLLLLVKCSRVSEGLRLCSEQLGGLQHLQAGIPMFK